MNRARHSVVLVLAAWACSVPAVLADNGVGALLRGCHDSAAAPAYVLWPAWAGRLLGVAGVCWGGWQLITALRGKSRRFSAGHAVLCAVLPVAALAVLVQGAVVRTAVQDSRARPSPRFGSARVASELRPGVRPTAAGVHRCRSGSAAGLAPHATSGGIVDA